MSTIVVQSVPAAQVGVASGMNANIRTIGGAFGSSVAASVLATGVTAANPLPKDAGYTHVFWLLAAAAVLATLAALIIPAVKARSAPTIDELSVDDGAVPAAA
jgi:sugar phosphate permease